MTALRTGLLPALLAATIVLGTVSVVQAAPTRRELQAREAFAAGRYQEALDLFAKLYAETLHPTYLRNIGRCHQNLGEPDKAISSFREYLRKAKGVAPEERAEVEGYIREMEELKKPTARVEAPPPVKTETPPPVLTVPPQREVAPRPTLVESSPARPVASSEPALYQRGWFWVLVGGVVVAGVAGGLLAGGVFSSKEPSCSPPRVCK